MSASYALNTRFLPYLFLIMFILVAMMTLMILGALNGNPALIYLSFFLLMLMAITIIVIVVIQKTELSFKRK